MASLTVLALAALAAPLVAGSPVRPRSDADFTPPPNIWTFPGAPSVTITVPTAFPGGSLVPDPVQSGGPMVPDPAGPGAPVQPDEPTDPWWFGGDAVVRPDVPTTSSSQQPPMQPTPKPMPFNPGGPMHPGRVCRREDGCDDDAQPTSTPTRDAAGACTFTVAAAATPLAHNPCSWNGVMTVYPSTTTILQAVDCHGCEHLALPRQHVYACPDMIISTSTSVATPSTRYRTVCAATATAAPAKGDA